MALCLVAAVRVFVFSAAFPFFNNVDEQYHFDLVLKYSHGHVPRTLEPLSLETLRYLALYGSPEYFNRPRNSLGFPPPGWTQPEPERSAMLAKLADRPPETNTESSHGPVYYTLAGWWMRAGRRFGLGGGYLLYWVRFLNVFLVAGLVWIAYAAAKQTFPADRFVRLGVPTLVAILPQDAFYSIQNDVLSPVFFGLAFLGLVRWLSSDKPGALLSIAIGLALAMLFLVKVSNLPLAAVGILAVLLRGWQRARGGRLRETWLSVALVPVCAGLPVSCWISWNLHTFGDATASAAKIRALGWTSKPAGEWLSHPIFTPGGFSYFWSELMARFWRGEFVWGLTPLASPAMDAFYGISSAVLIGVAVMSLLPRFSRASGTGREALLLGAVSFLAAVGYLAVLSVWFDFGQCWYPSRALPYFTSGRLILGALIPFLMLYLHGLDWAARRLKCEGLRWWLLAGIALSAGGSQIALNQVAFFSAYNWFHLHA